MIYISVIVTIGLCKFLCLNLNYDWKPKLFLKIPKNTTFVECKNKKSKLCGHSRDTNPDTLESYTNTTQPTQLSDNPDFIQSHPTFWAVSSYNRPNALPWQNIYFHVDVRPNIQILQFMHWSWRKPGPSPVWDGAGSGVSVWGCQDHQSQFDSDSRAAELKPLWAPRSSTSTKEVDGAVGQRTSTQI